MRCPNCYSDNVQRCVDKKYQGYGVGRGCCGWFFFGPVGLLCGLCGMGDVKNEKEYWICNNCGIKFNDTVTGEYQYAIQESVNKKISLIEAKCGENENSSLYEENKKMVKEVMTSNMTSDALSHIIFNANAEEDNRIFEIMKVYDKTDTNFETEYIYFMYYVHINNGIIVSSKGLHYSDKGISSVLYADDIHKITFYNSKIFINNGIELKFPELYDEDDKEIMVDVLKKLFIPVKPQISAQTTANGYGNHINDGCIVKLKDKLYYSRYINKKYQLVENCNGNEKVLMDEKIKQLGTDGEFLYAVKGLSIYKIDVNSSACEKMFDGNTFHIVNDEMVFSGNGSDNGLFITNLKTKETKKLSENMASNITVCDSWIYYVNNSAKEAIYKIKKDGTDESLVYNDKKCKNLVCDGEYLYFMGSNFLDLNDLYRININGGGLFNYELTVDDFNVTDNHIYGVQENKILRIKKDEPGNRVTLVKQETIRKINIIDGILYFCANTKMSGSHVTHYVDCEGGKIEFI